MARRRAGNRRRGGFWRGVLLFVNLTVSLALFAGAVAILYIGYRFRDSLKGIPSLAGMERPTPGGMTIVYATDRDPATGQQVVLGQVYDRFQEFSPIAEIPAVLQQATVAIEDERFFQHPGIDVWGIARAAVKNFQEKRMSEGASTLTQQLVKTLLLTRRKSMDRKMQEAVLALQIERLWTKEQILEKYVNEVPYGARIYGVKAAARYYFGKPLKDLNISEAALIAGLPQRPDKTDPFRHADAALKRRDMVLVKMRELGYITPDQERVERARQLKFLKEPPRVATKFKAPHFTNWVLRNLVKEYGKEMVYGGGLRIYTTLNWQMQQKAEAALRAGVREGRSDNVSEGALVCMEPRTGFIRAMVGSIDFGRDEYNFATGRTQPGSTFKPIVYTAAFETGKYDPDSTLYDGPIKIGTYAPKNYDRRFAYGEVTIARAIASSKNTIPVKLSQTIGIDRVIDCAKRLGIRSPLNRDLSLPLGTGHVTPLEMTDVYCAFANGGNRVEPLSVWKIVDADGATIETRTAGSRAAAVGESAVKKIDECLAGVVSYGTASSAPGIHEIEGARGKTGTTSENKDAWFIGYTPELVSTVYVFGQSIDPKTHKRRKLKMEGVTGGHVCAPIWVEFMKEAIPIQRSAGIVKESPGAGDDPLAGLTGASDIVSRTGVIASPSPSPTPGLTASGLATPAPDTTSDASLTPPPSDPAIAEPQPTPAPRPTAAPRATPTPRPTPTPEPIVSVSLCADTGLRANEYCPEVVRRRLRLSEAPRRVCREHGPSPEER